MKNIKIIADSTCDLSKELLLEYDIDIIPLNIILDDKDYRDGIDISNIQIYEWSDSVNKTPKTSAPSYESIMSVLDKYDRPDAEIIFIGISKEMSTTCNVVRLVGEELNYASLSIVDSRNLSTGIGLLVLWAALLRNQGESAENICTKLETMTSRVRASFVVETLTYLHRGGRCSSTTKMIANSLKLRPQLHVADGVILAGKKYRGKNEAVITKYVEDVIEGMHDVDSKFVFITHSGCSDEIVNMVRKKLESLNYFKHIYVTVAGSVVASHCGPNVLGVLYIE